MPQVNFYLKKPQRKIDSEKINNSFDVFIGSKKVATAKNSDTIFFYRDGKVMGKYQLKDLENVKKLQESKWLIYLQFKYNGRRLVFTFDQSVDPKDWNPKKQRVKESKQAIENGDIALNNLLDGLASECEKAYKLELVNGIPDPKVLKNYLKKAVDKNYGKGENEKSLFGLLDSFIKGEIRYKGKAKTAGTLRSYGNIKLNLEKFQGKTGYRVDFDTISLDFFNKFTVYLDSLNLGQNYKAKLVQMLKAIMNKANQLGYTTNITHKSTDFTVEWVDVDNVALTQKELDKLYKKDFSDNKRFDQVRDLFLVGCYTGLRWSDYSRIQASNIKTIDGRIFIVIKTKKTNQRVIIPANPVVVRIINKYKDSGFPKFHDQKFNYFIKDVCKEVGLDETNRLYDEPDKKLYECISSHTARRTALTNMYLEGFPPYLIKRISGHRTEKSFNTYLKISEMDAARDMSKHQDMIWAERLLAEDES
jgi:integrase